MGHSKKSTTLDTYTHVMVGAELAPARFLELLGCAGDDRVMTETPIGAAISLVEPNPS